MFKCLVSSGKTPEEATSEVKQTLIKQGMLKAEPKEITSEDPDKEVQKALSALKRVERKLKHNIISSKI